MFFCFVSFSLLTIDLFSFEHNADIFLGITEKANKQRYFSKGLIF